MKTKVTETETLEVSVVKGVGDTQDESPPSKVVKVAVHEKVLPQTLVIEQQTLDEAPQKGKEGKQKDKEAQKEKEKEDTEQIEEDEETQEDTPVKKKEKKEEKQEAPGKKKGRKKRRSSVGGAGVRDMDGIGSGYKRYVYKVLKQVHPELGVSSKAMVVIDAMMGDMFERLTAEAARLTAYTRRATLSSREIQGAVKLVLPGELGKHAISEGVKAVSKFVGDDGGGSSGAPAA